MHSFNIKTLLLTVVWYEYDKGSVKSDDGGFEILFFAIKDLCQISRGNFAKLD